MPKKSTYTHITPQVKQEIGTGCAHGKVILMGEHAVVYDYPAIALPCPAIQVTATARYTSHHAHYLSCRYYKGPLCEAPHHLDNIKAAIKLALAHCHHTGYPLHFAIDSQIPQERGMGSSAAVVTALIRAICDLYQVALSDNTLHYIVNQAEVIAHGSPSGLDTLMTSTLNPAIYQKGHTPRTFDMNLNAYLIVADSGQAGKTKQAVAHVKHLSEQSPEHVALAMTAIGEFTQQAFHAIQACDAQLLGRLMTYNHYYLSQLGISTPELDRIVKAAWLSGATGAKLTGGGLGGCVIALAKTQTQASLIAAAMTQAGAKHTWQFDL